MKLSCEILVDEEPELVERVFVAEEKEFKHGRAGYELKRTGAKSGAQGGQGGKVLITARAKDPTALRAVVTSVTRILNIITKTKEK